MFVYEFNIETQRPREVSSFDTLIVPFDNYIWSFACGLTLIEIILLMIMELMWLDITGTQFTNDAYLIA
jgi:hypothetical protein